MSSVALELALPRYRKGAGADDRLMKVSSSLGGLFGWAAFQIAFLHGTAADLLVTAADADRVRRAARQTVDGTSWLDAHLLRVEIETPRAEILTCVGEDTIEADVANVGTVIRLAESLNARRGTHFSERLIRTICIVGATECHLGSESEGMRWSDQVPRIRCPELLGHDKGRLVRAQLGGMLLEHEADPGRRGVLYEAAVLAWTATVLDDGILQIGLRRDTLVSLDDGDIGSLRWAGTRQASGAVKSIVRSAMLASYGESGSRTDHRTVLGRVIGTAIGSARPLDATGAFVIGLLPGQDKIDPGRLVEELGSLSASSPTQNDENLFLLIRQLAWFRDLAEHCAPDDMSRPWEQVASRLANS